MKARYTIIGLALLINMISYIDRVSIGVAAPGIRSEFGLSPSQLGLVFGAFSLSYALLQAPWGAAADRFGAQAIVAIAITGWSAFTALTAAAWNFVSLLAVRFAFGGLEAGLSPAVASAFGRWIPPDERSRAFGIFLSGGRLGGAVAPGIAAVLVARHGWRASFIAFAALGIVAALAWWAAVGRISAVPEASARKARPAVSYRKLARSRPLIGLLLVAFCYTFMWQFYATWFPTYLMERRGFSLARAGTYAGLPFLFGLAANWIGGFLMDWASRNRGAAFGRGVLGFVALFISALVLYAGIVFPEAGVAAFLIALAAGFGDLFLGAAWASAVDIGGEAAGAASGLMNSFSNLGGFVSPLVMGWALQQWHNWDSVLFVAAAANVLASFLWLAVHARGLPRLAPAM